MSTAAPVTSPGEQLELGDLNLAETLREMARWSPAADLVETRDLLLVAGADAFPVGFANAVMRVRPSAQPAAAEVLERAAAFFAERDRGYTVWIRDHLDADLAQACQASGLIDVSSSPGMVLEEPLPAASDPEGSTLRFVDDVDAAREFAWVSARAYAPLGLPIEATEALFGEPERLLRPHIVSVVARLGEEPVSAAQVILSHSVGGVYWVGTALAGRRRGLGEACTRAVGNAAFERGARLLVLQASRQGEPIYRRMGYREITRYGWYAALRKPA